MERTIDMPKLTAVRSNYNVTITQHEYDRLVSDNYQLVAENDSLRAQLQLYRSSWLIRFIAKFI